MLQKIRLSAAYLVNPTLAKQAEVEYFISDDKLRDANIESMANFQKRENVTAAFSNDGKYFKILGDHAQESTKGLDEWKRGFITDDKTLADKLNGEPVVTWGGVRRLNVEKDFGLQNPSSR